MRHYGRSAVFLHRSVLMLNPGAPFLPNWHLEAIAYRLEQVRHGKITRLIINLPPRSLKSIFVSVVLPAFLLGHNPRLKSSVLVMGASLPPSTPMIFGRLCSHDGIAKPFPICRSPAWRIRTFTLRLAAFERRRR